MEIEHSDVDVKSLHQLIGKGRWRMESPHSSPRARFYWITKGQGTVTASGLSRGFGSHTAIFLPARTMVSFELSQTLLGTRVTFPVDLTSQLPEDAQFLRVRDSRRQAELTQVIDQVSAEVRDQGPGWFAAARSYAALIAVHLDRLSHIYRGDTAIMGSSQRIVQGYTALIEEHLGTGNTVGDYSAMLGITPTHLTRVCREIVGKTASDLLAERTITEARRLLEDTDLPIREIAENLGFGSAAYFTRAFGQRTGQTPSVARANAHRIRLVA